MKPGIESLRLIAILWLALSVSGLLGAEAARAANSSSGPTQTVYLEYQEYDFTLMNIGYSVELQSVPFKKEPDFQNRKVFRGNFRFGAKMPVPFVWDNTNRKLYLDLNRNGDLTDDPRGVFSRPTESFTVNYQIFTNVVLDFKAPGGLHQFRVDLHLQHYSNYRNDFNAHAALKSFWVGKLTLAGQEWQIGVADNLLGQGDAMNYLLLRPWKERSQPFSLQDGSLETFFFTRKIFFQNQAYDLNCIFEGAGERPRYKVELKEEQQPKLGELKLTGKFIQRMILRGPDSTVVLDRPGPVVKIPVGSYNQLQLMLQEGEARVFRSLSRGLVPESPVNISESKAAVLAAGGPLTNSVATQRRRKQLSLNYQLVGLNGDTYQTLRRGSMDPPLFAIFQGDKKIHSGKFEFG